jgi:hypothetical protein
MSSVKNFLNHFSYQARTKKIVQQIVRLARPMNSDAEAMEIVCQWRSIAME